MSKNISISPNQETPQRDGKQVHLFQIFNGLVGGRELELRGAALAIQQFNIEIQVACKKTHTQRKTRNKQIQYSARVSSQMAASLKKSNSEKTIRQIKRKRPSTMPIYEKQRTDLVLQRAFAFGAGRRPLPLQLVHVAPILRAVRVDGRCRVQRTPMRGLGTQCGLVEVGAQRSARAL